MPNGVASKDAGSPKIGSTEDVKISCPTFSVYRLFSFFSNPIWAYGPIRTKLLLLIRSFTIRRLTGHRINQAVFLGGFSIHPAIPFEISGNGFNALAGMFG